MEQAEQPAPPPPIQPESSTLWPRLLPWIATGAVLLLYIAVKILSFLNPEWLNMRVERHYTMQSPAGIRKAPDSSLLETFPALPTGWHGAPILQFAGQSPPNRWSVDLGNGGFVHVQTDFYLPDVIPINLSRTYSSLDAYSDRDFGVHASASYEIYLLGDNTVYSYMNMIFPDGSIVLMPRVSPGTSYDATYEHRAAKGDTSDFFDKARLWWHSPWYFSSLKDGTGIVFPASRWAREWGQRSAIMIQDAKGNVLDIKRDEAGNILEITSPNGQKLVLNHDYNNRITVAYDSRGDTIRYTYDDRGRLADVTDSKGEVTHYTYDGSDNMLTITEPDGHTWLSNTYDNRHRITDQIYWDGTHAHFAYQPPDLSGTTVTEVSHSDGSRDSYKFNKKGSLLTHTHLSSPPKSN
jgi:YD repeat-containing protein